MTETTPASRDTLFEPIATLKRLAKAGEGPLDIIEGALALAVLERPTPRLTSYREHLDRMVGEVAAATGTEPGPEEPVAPERGLVALNHVILGLHGYHGDQESYDDLQNANLLRVIDRRKGLPVALGILYMHVARAQGWGMEGLAFPGHFLVRMDCNGQRLIVDPFNEGAVVEAADMRALLKAMSGADAELLPEHYSTVSDRSVLLRLQNNIKIRLIRARQYDEAATLIEGMLALAPDQLTLWRESGLINARIGKVKAAILALESYMDREPSEPARREAAELVADLRSRVN